MTASRRAMALSVEALVYDQRRQLECYRRIHSDHDF